MAALSPKPRLDAAGRTLRLGRRNGSSARCRRASIASQRRLALGLRALESLSPAATLARGYAIVSGKSDGSVITDSASVSAGAELDVRLARGQLAVTVDAAHDTRSRAARMKQST